MYIVQLSNINYQFDPLYIKQCKGVIIQIGGVVRLVVKKYNWPCFKVPLILTIPNVSTPLIHQNYFKYYYYTPLKGLFYLFTML